MNYILADQHRDSLLPFTFTRPVANIRVGILTLAEKWEKWLQAEVSYLTQDYLSKKFPLKVEADNVVINPSFLPNQELVEAIHDLKENQQLVANGTEIAKHTADVHAAEGFETVEFSGDVLTIVHPWDIFSKNGEALQADFDLLTKGRKSQPIPDTNTVINPENIFLEEGAKVSCSILNASTGPIYVGKDAEIMEGCIIRGPLAMCKNSVLKMGAKIYGASTFGPYCKVGGEVSNAVLFAYSNKGHEGFLGNSVLGEWCNLGCRY